jgi:hypothetical protein
MAVCALIQDKLLYCSDGLYASSLCRRTPAQRPSSQAGDRFDSTPFAEDWFNILLTTPISGITEGINTRIKLIKRQG